MNIIINTSSMIPIYEQIIDEIKMQITEGTLTQGDCLPSVRTLAKELKISALTVKKAYDELENQGFIQTVHGKGSFVRTSSKELIKEEQIKIIEKEMAKTVEKARAYGLLPQELKNILDLILEETE